MLTVKTKILCDSKTPQVFTGREIKERNGVYKFAKGCDTVSRFVIYGDVRLLVQDNYCAVLNIDGFYEDKFVEANDKVSITFE